MLNCREVLQELNTYFDESLAEDVRRDLEEHLRQCRHCRVVLDSTKHTLRIIADCKTFDLPETLSERIMTNIRKGEKPS